MKILLDDCVPAQVRHAYAGHDASTVQGQGWTGIKNGALLAAAGSAGFNLLVMLTKTFAINRIWPVDGCDSGTLDKSPAHSGKAFRRYPRGRGNAQGRGSSAHFLAVSIVSSDTFSAPPALPCSVLSSARKKRAYSWTPCPSNPRFLKLCSCLILRAEHAITLVNIDPNIVHINSSFPFLRSLRCAELFSCYLTPFNAPAKLS